ncbi:hypothetical protein LTS01_026077, partial [Friedmanniomyces endolithicus]
PPTTLGSDDLAGGSAGEEAAPRATSPIADRRRPHRDEYPADPPPVLGSPARDGPASAKRCVLADVREQTQRWRRTQKILGDLQRHLAAPR